MALDTATVAVVDAKDEARQAELRTDMANALLTVEQRMTSMTRWLAVLIMAAALGSAGLVITVLSAVIE